MDTPKKKLNTNKQLRLTETLAERIERLVANSSLAEADVLRSAIEAGLDRLESGDWNPFAPKKVHPAASMGLALAGAM